MEVIPKDVVPPHQARVNELKLSIGVKRVVEKFLACITYKESIKYISLNFICLKY